MSIVRGIGDIMNQPASGSANVDPPAALVEYLVRAPGDPSYTALNLAIWLQYIGVQNPVKMVANAMKQVAGPHDRFKLRPETFVASVNAHVGRDHHSVMDTIPEDVQEQVCKALSISLPASGSTQRQSISMEEARTGRSQSASRTSSSEQPCSSRSTTQGSPRQSSRTAGKCTPSSVQTSSKQGGSSGRSVPGQHPKHSTGPSSKSDAGSKPSSSSSTQRTADTGSQSNATTGSSSTTMKVDQFGPMFLSEIRALAGRTESAWRMYTTLAVHCGYKDRCWPSTDKVEEVTGYSRQMQNKVLKRYLSDIVRVVNRGRHPNMYILHLRTPMYGGDATSTGISTPVFNVTPRGYDKGGSNDILTKPSGGVVKHGLTKPSGGSTKLNTGEIKHRKEPEGEPLKDQIARTKARLRRLDSTFPHQGATAIAVMLGDEWARIQIRQMEEDTTPEHPIKKPGALIMKRANDLFDGDIILAWKKKTGQYTRKAPSWAEGENDGK